ncbi:MAG: hypothetical protein AVO38_05495 [delta proteobacterium ML8_D]|jgi:choice-of-anchor C domain-containing protein|nr:MAG: hypothetical protein AVO38_05495 [delta proteobacterium ML8_D]
MKKGIQTGLLAVALVLAGATLAFALPIYSESFEADEQIQGFNTVGAGGTVGNSMIVTGGEVDWIGTYWQASDGTHSLDMSGSQLGTIAEVNLNTIIGNLYEVSFDMAGNPVGPPELKNMYASINPPLEVYAFSFDTSSTNVSDMGWISNSFQFTAESMITTLLFGDLSINLNNPLNNFYGAALDNIVVDDLGIAPAPVPEPATLLLMATGLIGLVGFRKKFKK